MTSTPHDSVFKAVFQQPEHAAAELQHVLPADLAEAILWPSLTLEPGSFVDPELAGQHSDLLFSANASASGERVLVYLLFEHQSTQDHRMALRLLGYMLRVWTRYTQDHPDGPLPLIIPAVLAQVPGGWKSPTRFSELFSADLGTLGRDAIPDFAYAVDDLHHTTDDDLRRRPLAEQAKLTLWLMRDIRDSSALLRNLVGWTDALETLARRPGGDDAFALLLHYIAFASDDLQLSEFRDILRGRAPAAESLSMTIAEQLRAEGRIEGETKGRAEGQVEGKGAALLVILGARGFHVSDDVQQRIGACTDIEVLDHWIALAVSVPSADDIFKG